MSSAARLSRPVRTPPRWLTPLMCVLVALACACACACASPHVAYAYFNEVDDKNSAQQDIGDYGDAINAADIPDGTYTGSVRTTSRMCVLYNTAADAATRSDNKELCTLTVSGGSIVASFYLSPAYTHIYLGTGEQAAALTDSTGTDETPYVKGVANAVNTGSGTANAYYYTMTLSALNSPVVLATYDGGSTSIEEGKWFNRKVVFMPGDDLEKAIQAAKNPQQEPEPESAPASDPDPKSEASESAAQPQQPATDPAQPEDDPVQNAKRQPETVYVYVDEPADAASALSGLTQQGGEGAAADGAAGAIALGGRGAVRLRAVQAEAQPADAPGASAEAVAATDAEAGPSAEALAGAVIAAAALFGCALRAVLFALGKAGLWK